MKTLMEEYGDAIYHGIMALLCVTLLLFFGRTIVGKETAVYKTATYNSDSYSKDDAPEIILNKNTIIVDKDSVGCSTSDEILSSLKSKQVYQISDETEKSITVKARGTVNTAVPGNYNIEIVASNKFSVTTAGVTITITDDNTSY